MAAGLYQVVSEHSILGALEATRQKTMESRPENTKRQRRHHAPTRRSERRGEILKKCEEILENLRSSISDLKKESEGVKEGRETDAPEKNQSGGIKETSQVSDLIEKSEVEKDDEENTIKDCVSSLRLAIAPKQIGSNQMEKNLRNQNLQISDVVESSKQVDDELKSEQQMIHAQPPEPPEPPDRGLLMTEGVICDWKEQRLTHATAAVNVLEEAERDGGDEIPSSEELMPAETSSELPLPLIYGAAMDERPSREMLFLSHEVDVMIFRAARMRYTEWVEKKEGSDWEERGAPPLDCGATVTEVCSTCDCEDLFLSLKADACELRSVGGINSFDVGFSATVGKSTQFNNIGWVLQVAGGLENNERNHQSALLAVPTPLLDHFFNYFFILQLSPCLHKQSTSKPIKAEAIEQHFERKQRPTNVELRGSIILDSGEVVKRIKLIMGVGRIYCKGSQLLCIGIGNINKFLVGLGRSGGSGDMQLQNISLMEPLFAHQWDPGGLKRNDRATTSAMECHRNQTYQHQVFLKFQQYACLFDDSSGAYMNSKASKSPVFYNQLSTVVEFIVKQEIGIGCKGRAHRSAILVPSRDFAFAIMSTVLTQEFQPLHWTSLWLMVVKLEHIQWELGGDYYSLLMCSIESLSFKLWDYGRILLLLLEHHCLVPDMKVEMIRQVAHEVINNWNGIVLFHDFNSHKVMMLASIVILNCEWGAHKADDLENIIQAWLQTRQEVWVEHSIQGLESSRRSMREAYHKQWDPGEPYLVFCTIGTSCFKLWDPGGRLVTACFWYLHLEDKVNFKGAGIDTIASEKGRIGNIRISMKERSGNQFMGTTSTHSLIM